MGQAKRRGTFEHRKKLAMIRDNTAWIMARDKELARRAKMTDEEKRIEFENKIFFSQVITGSRTEWLLTMI